MTEMRLQVLTYLSHGNRVVHGSFHAGDESFACGCADKRWYVLLELIIIIIIIIIGRRHDARALVGVSGVL
jgi:hypothetical protein